MKRLKFDFVTDDRFDKDIYNKLVLMDKQLKELLKHLPVTVDSLKIRELHFNGGKGMSNEPTNQYRKTYYLTKLNRSITWNDIYGTINKIYAPYYSFIN